MSAWGVSPAQTAHGMRNQMKGKTCIVTGANSGIGKATACALARKGAHVVMLCRSEARGTEAREEILRTCPSSRVDLIVGDLACSGSIREFADRFKRDHGRLDVLVNNAGVYMPERMVNAAGYELTFAINHLGTFLLTTALFDILKASAPSRVVTVSSAAHAIGRMAFDDLQMTGRYRPFLAYCNSKLANVLFSNELARRMHGTGVTSNALHPGVVATGWAQDEPSLLGRLMGVGRRFLSTPETGARTSVYLASSHEVAEISGGYFSGCCPRRPARKARRPEDAARLWELSEQMA